MQHITGMVPAVKTATAWDGGDGVAPEEDEYDLNDLMNEEL